MVGPEILIIVGSTEEAVLVGFPRFSLEYLTVKKYQPDAVLLPPREKPLPGREYGGVTVGNERSPRFPKVME